MRLSVVSPSTRLIVIVDKIQVWLVSVTVRSLGTLSDLISMKPCLDMTSETLMAMA